MSTPRPLFIFELNYLKDKGETMKLKDKGETMKSGVYFVHYDDIDAFLKHIELNGRELDGLVTQLKLPKHKDQYRAFSIDNGRNKRVGYWGTYELEAMKRWDKWYFTDEYIELWTPRKVML